MSRRSRWPSTSHYRSICARSSGVPSPSISWGSGSTRLYRSPAGGPRRRLRSWTITILRKPFNDFPTDEKRLIQGHVFLLTHPGVPCVFLGHFYDRGASVHDTIKALGQLRNKLGITRTSWVEVLQATSFCYAAKVHDRLIVKIGDDFWNPGSSPVHGNSNSPVMAGPSGLEADSPGTTGSFGPVTGCDVPIGIVRVSCEPSLWQVPAYQVGACATPRVPWPDSGVPALPRRPHATADFVRGELVTSYRIPQSAN